MTKKIKKPEEDSFIKTLLAAIICAVILRSFLFEPFHIPSSSMKPNLLIGDYIFVAKYSYGYSRYSFPFGIKFFEGRVFEKSPKRGDVSVFRLPSDPSINYVKRVIGLPGDKIQMREGVLYINDQKIEKVSDGIFREESYTYETKEIAQFLETLPEGKVVETLDERESPADDTGIYTVPEGNYFMMGDNRDNSQDSRFQNYVGYVPKENLIGRATYIFFSSEEPIWKIWKWNHSIRLHRIFKKID
ncbi:MAG: signal peptidase I [Rickettsiales bacterium]|nr:signal peptidase I [Rickettsiales bacterium]